MESSILPRPHLTSGRLAKQEKNIEKNMCSLLEVAHFLIDSNTTPMETLMRLKTGVSRYIDVWHSILPVQYHDSG